MKKMALTTTLILMVGAAIVVPTASATTDCAFATVGTTMTLLGDCTTDATIVIPDGFTLDGKGNTITAVDPPLDHFRGAVVANGGASAYVIDLGVTASGLANVCDAGADRLRGIMFEGASGAITKSTVTGINQGSSGCQEGNAIEIRNAPFDGTHPDTQTVTITHNIIGSFQKTGIVANGDVDVTIEHNKLTAAGLDDFLASNTIQFGFGATGAARQNHIDGNQWCGASDFAATAVLVFLADGVDVSKNVIGGNSDVAVYISGDDATIDNNKASDDPSIADCNVNGYDFGFINFGSDNAFTNNKAKGFDTPYYGVTGGKNKQVPGPSKGEAFF